MLGTLTLFLLQDLGDLIYLGRTFADMTRTTWETGGDCRAPSSQQTRVLVEVKAVTITPVQTGCGRCVWPGFHTEGGGDGGGFIPLMILARGDIPPIKLQNSVFLMGIIVKSFKKVFRRQIPFFSKFVSSNCPPP